MRNSSLKISSIALMVMTILISDLFAREKLSLGDIQDISNNHSVIYGEDDRHNLYDYEDTTVQRQSKSVAIMISNKRLIPDRENPLITYLPFLMLQNRVGALCKDEAYAQEISVGDCTGFLVSPKILLTAAHCINTQKLCESNKWVFGYDQSKSELESKNIYSCKNLITSKCKKENKLDCQNSKTEFYDYALIELDREVEGYEPLKIRKKGFVKKNTPLYVIGHPLGLSTKVTDGAKVTKMSRDESKSKIKSLLQRRTYFTANIDAYFGNSGSPVFNKNTGMVEGMLIQGATDFQFNYDRDCQESARRPDNHKSTVERVLKINKIPELKEILKNQDD